MNRDSLGDRMKRYEVATRTTLTPRTPVVIRVDGKDFHTYTRGLQTFSEAFKDAMDGVARMLCHEVQGCVFGYVQSDEINLLLHTYKRYSSDTWFGGQVQKVVSVAAGIASSTMTAQSVNVWGEIRPAVFDARAFVLPECEVANYFIWRQQDCIRNRVQMLSRSVFSHKECHGKNCNELRYMLSTTDKQWDALDDSWRYGRVCTRFTNMSDDGLQTMRTRWVVEPPFLCRAGESREFKQQHEMFADLMACEPEAQ